MLILTLNEGRNIERCIRACRFSDDIVVLDSFSTDNTVELAEAAGVRVFQRAFDTFASQRNYALDNIHCKHEWILHLDADEVVTPELREEISTVIKDPRFAAYRIASKLMFMDKWLKFSGMYPVYQVRLGRKDLLRFEQVGHGQRESLMGNVIGTLTQPYVHHGFSKGIADWIERHNRYSTAEAMRGSGQLRSGDTALRHLFSAEPTKRRRALKKVATHLPFRPFLRFFYMYFLRLGFLDGCPGYVYCRLLAQYEYWIVLKVRELKKSSR